mmetsp:Transcript_55177/g.162204  ORF Transcript_55177/g.162204 Transcript_55177/m.162204 type:complete len:80 (+) Transcript_55177:148-387(+)
MSPNKDGWLSVDTVDEAGRRVTVFHGCHDVHSEEAVDRWMRDLLLAVREHRSGGEGELGRKLVPLHQGRVVVSVPEATS